MHDCFFVYSLIKKNLYKEIGQLFKFREEEKAIVGQGTQMLKILLCFGLLKVCILLFQLAPEVQESSSLQPYFSHLSPYVLASFLSLLNSPSLIFFYPILEDRPEGKPEYRAGHSLQRFESEGQSKVTGSEAQGQDLKRSAMSRKLGARWVQASASS